MAAQALTINNLDELLFVLRETVGAENFFPSKVKLGRRTFRPTPPEGTNLDSGQKIVIELQAF